MCTTLSSPLSRPGARPRAPRPRRWAASSARRIATRARRRRSLTSGFASSCACKSNATHRPAWLVDCKRAVRGGTRGELATRSEPALRATNNTRVQATLRRRNHPHRCLLTSFIYERFSKIETWLEHVIEQVAGSRVARTDSRSRRRSHSHPNITTRHIATGVSAARYVP